MAKQSEKRKASKRRWYKNHSAEATSTSQKYRQALRAKALVKLGSMCANPACQWLNGDGSRGCKDARCLQIDHVNGNGKLERKELGYIPFLNKVLKDTTGAYQLLCSNCNWIKRHDNGEY